MILALVSLACIFGGALLGFALSKLLPEHHLSADSKDAVKMAAGMISMMAALVIGLLVSSAKQHFDSTNSAIVESAAKLVLLDKVLTSYGPEATDLREQLRAGVLGAMALLWPEEHVQESLGKFQKATALEGLARKVRALKPANDPQRALQQQALDFCNELLLSRWLQIAQAQTPLPLPFFVILLFWLTILYVGFGLLGPKNLTVLTAMFAGALSLATALFLILEMSRPMDGVIKVSSAPLRKALELLAR